MKINLSTQLINESIEDNVREECEKKLGRLPLWWYPLAAISFGIPLSTLALIIFT